MIQEGWKTWQQAGRCGIGAVAEGSHLHPQAGNIGNYPVPSGIFQEGHTS